MDKVDEHHTKTWEISIIKLQNEKGSKYKVKRRRPQTNIAETKVFLSKKQAKNQFDTWLDPLGYLGFEQFN